METAVRELQIPQYRRDLMDAIDGLGQKLKSLEERLQPVLTPPGPLAPPVNGKLAKLGEARAERVELAEFLFAQRNRISDLTEQVNQLVNRCEL